ncbi:MAG: class I SAM-dependent methyltransferase [Woeseia sp.]
MDQKDHWEHVYASRPIEKLGWYKPHLQTSLAWIKDLELATDAPIVDVGGGASTLVDDLLDAGYRSVTVLDLSEKALCSVRTRLGQKSDRVTWLNGDITSIELPAYHYELWHDRAVFHFLTEPDQQGKYQDNLRQALQPGGHLIIGAFAPEAPPRCSGLPVQRYSQEQLQDALGEEFDLVRHRKEKHSTPGGIEQMYLYCHFRRTAGPADEITSPS